MSRYDEHPVVIHNTLNGKDEVYYSSNPEATVREALTKELLERGRVRFDIRSGPGWITIQDYVG